MQGGIDGWRAEMMAVGLAFATMIVCFFMVGATVVGHDQFTDPNLPSFSIKPYERHVGCISLIVGCIVGCLGYFECKRSIQGLADTSVRWQQQALLDQLIRDNDRYYKEVVNVVLPNRTAVAFVDRLKRVDTADCSPKFKSAFEEYIRAWSDLASFIENNSGLPGILEAFKTGGFSLLEGWLRLVPDKVAAVKKAEADMDRIASIKRH